MFGFLAQLLNWCYTIWPNYLGMVVIFTLILMVVITPFTVKGMRSAAEMSRLQPEIKKLQDQYKNDRIKQNEEMQALFKEHGVNPLGGCLPTLLPLPIFFIVFRLLERMNGHKTGAAAPLVRLLRNQVGGSGGYVAPHYLAYHDKLTQSIIRNGGHLKAFGMDLALTARAHHSSVGAALPFYILILVMTASQYWQQRQINQRNPAAANANPQMKMTMQLFPAFYAIISLNIPATVVFYLLISGLFRMAQNSISYRYDPVLKRAAQPLPAGGGTGGAGGGAIEAKSRPKGPAPLPSGKPGTPPRKAGGRAAAQAASPAPKPGGFMDRLRAQAAEAKAQAERAQQDRAKGGTGASSGRGAPSGRAQGRPGSAPSGNGKAGGARGKPQPGPRPEAAAGSRPPEPAQEAQPEPATEDSRPASVADQIAATEAEIDAAINATVPPPEGTGGDVAAEEDTADEGANGGPQPRPSSPLRVSRPSGRATPPPKGRRPRSGQ